MVVFNGCGRNGKGVGAVVGRTLRWLAFAVVAGLAGVALWWNIPATQGDAPGGSKVAPSAAVADLRANAAASRPIQGRPLAAGRVEAFEALKQRAEAGDAVAQRLLAQTYADCLFVNLDREAFKSSLEIKKNLLNDDASKQLMERAASERIAECDAVEGGDPLPLDLSPRWFAKAAENGDLAARAMVRANNLNRQDPAETAQLLEEVLASGDPAAVFTFGLSLRNGFATSNSEPSEPLATGELATKAWMVAACRMGYECEPSGRVMNSACLNVEGCTGEDVETYLRRELPTDGERAELERRVSEILALVEGQ